MGRSISHSERLFAQTEGFERCFVGIKVRPLKVAEQPLAPADHLLEATTSHVVVLVGLKVFGHLFDTSRQDRHLRLWAADVILADLSQSNRFRFVILSNHTGVL